MTCFAPLDGRGWERGRIADFIFRLECYQLPVQLARSAQLVALGFATEMFQHGALLC